MYVQPIFEQSETSVLHQFVRDHPFGALTVWADDGLEVDHIPLELQANAGELGTLRGHVSRANTVWQRLDPSIPALVVFQGPHAYISPSWLSGRSTHGKVAPSWNYAVVHAYGTVRIQHDPSWLREHLAALSAHQEAGRADPWHLGEAPSHFTGKMVEYIVGLEISITRLLGKFQLGQQYRESDRQGVIEGLSREAHPMSGAVASLIRQVNAQP